MKVGYLDSSMLLSVVFEEPGSERFASHIQSFGRVFSSNLLEAEVRSALAREGIDGSVSLELLDRVAWVFPDRPLESEFRTVLESGYLRGSDLWHLACALYLGGSHKKDVELLSLDRRQLAVAERLGLKTV